MRKVCVFVRSEFLCGHSAVLRHSGGRPTRWRANKLRNRGKKRAILHTRPPPSWSCHQPIKVIARRLGIEPAACDGFSCCTGCSNGRRRRFMTVAFSSYSKSQPRFTPRRQRRSQTFLTTTPSYTARRDMTCSDSWRSVCCHYTANAWFGGLAKAKFRASGNNDSGSCRKVVRLVRLPKLCENSVSPVYGCRRCRLFCVTIHTILSLMTFAVVPRPTVVTFCSTMFLFLSFSFFCLERAESWRKASFLPHGTKTEK